MRQVRLWVVGFGTVGQWLVRALNAHAGSLADRYGIAPIVVGIANARDGFIYRSKGLDVPTVLGLASSGRSLAEHPGIRRLPSALEGLGATEADLLVEVTASRPADGEPGFTHMRDALGRRIPVVTSNKWPVALHGVELVELARSQAVAFRAEATVMSGTPVLSTLVEGLAGTTPTALRGVLNATANFILSGMTRGKSYEDALAEAQAIGLAERDPAADVDGHDAKAKTMILAALVFGRQLRSEEVVRSGISGMTRAEMGDAARGGTRIKHVSTLEFSGEGGNRELKARVEPVHLRSDDPLASIDGSTNAVVCRSAPVGEVTIIGPGAGPALAGQGVLSDLIAVAGKND
jgi:homoserine dehydrogenase